MWKFVLASLTLVFVANCRGDDDSPAPATDIKSGTSSTLWSYQEKYPSVMATGSLERGEAFTEATLTVSGLSANAEYPVHIHVLPCARGAGAHYMHNKMDMGDGMDHGNMDHGDMDMSGDGMDMGGDDMSMEEIMKNEIHLTFTTDANGNAEKIVRKDWRARDEAVSIVIHETTNSDSKLICIDLQ